MTRFLASFIIVVASVSWPFLSVHASIVASPAIIDESGQARDVFNHRIILKNDGENKVDLYAVVGDVTAQGSERYLGPGSSDRQSSLASWISFRRGAIELMPGASVEESLDINPDSSAQAGLYHAVIALSQGSNRPEAEAAAASAPVKIYVNVEIKDNIIEKAQLRKFISTRKVFTSSPISLSAEVYNQGNRDLKIGGAVLIHDRKGREIAQLPVDERMANLSPDKLGVYDFSWADCQLPGRYKARLEMEYGMQSRDIQDTVYFWYLPWKYLFVFVLVFVSAVMALAYFIFKRTYQKSDAHEESLGKEEAEDIEQL